MTTLNYKPIAWTIGALVVGTLIFAPVAMSPARVDDDDWEDRWAQYDLAVITLDSAASRHVLVNPIPVSRTFPRVGARPSRMAGR